MNDGGSFYRTLYNDSEEAASVNGELSFGSGFNIPPAYGGASGFRDCLIST